MALRTTTDGTASPAQSSIYPPYTRIAFSAWAAAFAVGTLFHEWQFIQQPFAEHGLHAFQPQFILNTMIVTAAFAVILRPTAVWRMMLLLALMAGELLKVLPNPQNHLMFIGLVSPTIVVWWLWLRWRAPEQAADPAVMYQRMVPYLRVGFIMIWYFAAISKVNSGFGVVNATCSVWILELIPGVHIPDPLVPAVIAGTLLTEFSVPTLLLYHRTRPFAIIIGFGFHLVSALAGHAAFSGFAWSFYLLFLPPVVLARAIVVGRRSLPDGVRRAMAAVTSRAPIAVVVFAGLWMTAAAAMPVVVDKPWLVRRWGAGLVCVVWMSLTGLLLARLRRHWLPTVPLVTAPPGPRASLQVRNGLFLLGLAALVFTAAMPYLGLKTRAAFTMYANLRTEPGHWNHLLIPESVRIFDWQDGDVRLLGSDDPALLDAIADQDGQHTTLVGARRIVDDFPNATVRYQLDGVEHVAAPLASDPVLGKPVSIVQEWFGAMRPYVEGGTCQH